MDEKELLIQRLDQARAKMQAVIQVVDAAFRIYPPWTIKQILAHIAGWDDAVTASLRAHIAGDIPAVPAARGIDTYNAQTVAEREALSYPQIIREWEVSREQFKQAIRDLPPERLSVPFIFPWGPQSTLDVLVKIFAEHELEHAEEVLRIVEQHNTQATP